MALTTITSGGLGDNSVDTDQLAASAVETAKINNDAVTGDKIENSPTIASNLTVAGDLAVTGNYGHSIEMFYPLRPWVTTTSYYAHTHKIEDASDPVACSGVAPSGFTGISNMYVIFYIQNPDELIVMQVNWSLAGDNQTKATHQVSNTVVTECSFTPSDPGQNNFMFKKSWLGLSGGSGFEDTIAAGDTFGIQFAQPSTVDCYMIGVTIVWDF